MQVLQKAEAERWKFTTVPYDPISVHTAVPLILHENQRLDTRFKTLAMSGGYPKFSASGLGRQGRRAPFELRLPSVDIDTGAKDVPAWRSDVQLPLREDPWHLPRIGGLEVSIIEGAERSHFWLLVSCIVLVNTVAHPLADQIGFSMSPILQWMPRKGGNMPDLLQIQKTNGLQNVPLLSNVS